MKRLTLAVTALTFLACELSGADAFRDGVPSADSVALKVPSGTSSGLTGSGGRRRDGLEGQTAEFYKMTRGVTLIINGGTAAVLGLVHHITTYTPSSVSDDSATCATHTDSLSPYTWKLTVTRTATDTYSYELLGRGKTEDDSAFRVILSGTHHHMGQNVGAGSFVIDWDKAQELPEHDDNVGTATLTYARPALDGTTDIDAVFEQIKGHGDERVDAHYVYRATHGEGGAFEYNVYRDTFWPGSGVELAKMKSRWLENGAGRSDATLSGGDLGATVTANECWDELFLSRYLTYSWDSSQNYGTEGLCAFPTAEYSSL